MPLLEVRQDTFLAAGEGTAPPSALLRMGVLVTASKWDLFALGGKMFTLGETTVGTLITAQAADTGGIVLTAPTIRFTVPTGTTVFPRALSIGFGAMAGTINEIAIIANNADSYTSGGTAATPVNIRTDSAAASTAVTNCKIASGSAITEAALTTPRHLYKTSHPVAMAASAGADQIWNVEVKFDDLLPIVGPASFLVYIGAANTAPTFLYAMRWVEMDTTSVIS